MIYATSTDKVNLLASFHIWPRSVFVRCSNGFTRIPGTQTVNTTDSEVMSRQTQTLCLPDSMHIKRGRITEMVESKSSHLRSQTPSPRLFVAPVR